MKKQIYPFWMIFPVTAAGIALAIVFLGLPVEQSPSKAQTSTPNYQTARVQQGGEEASISASGAVRSNQSATLTWQTGGIVDKVNGAQGQIVKAGAVLAELEQTSLPQNVILARVNLVAAQKALENLLTLNQDRAAAQLALVKAQQALDDATKTRYSKQFQRASQETIDIARANLIQARASLRDQEKIYDSNKMRNSDDVVYAAALSQLASAQQKYNQANYNYLYVQGLPSSLDIQEADANVAVAQANVQAAEQQWARVKDGPNDQDVAAAQAQVAAAQATLNMARISAPFDGTLTLANSKPGDQVAAGTPAFQLDDLSRLLADVFVSQGDVNHIQASQPVSIVFDVIPGKEYSGRVTQVSLVGKTSVGLVNYTVTIEIAQKSLEIRPGMTLNAVIHTGQGKNILLVPASSIRNQNGQNVIYLLKNGAPIAIAVALGDTSRGVTQVLDGSVKAGDLVIINPNGLTAPLTPLLTPQPTILPTNVPATPQVTFTPTATLAAPGTTGPAVQTVQDYFTALQNEDYNTASNLTSNFSLVADNLTRAGWASTLQSQLAQGTHWSELQVIDARLFDDKTALVHVRYLLSSRDPKTAAVSQALQDELWPVRLENGSWLVNHNNLIDTLSLNVPEQATAGLQVKPLQLLRYSDHIRLVFLAQNTTNEPIVLGQTNEVLAAFRFGDRKIEAEKTQLIFDRLHSYPQAWVEVKGLFQNYPDGVEIRRWKNVQVAPWFIFSFSQ